MNLWEFPLVHLDFTDNEDGYLLDGETLASFPVGI